MIAKVEDEVRKQAEELLERVGMQDYENSYPRELSGGQKQRVAIVRAMAMNPKILLLDEITASLDHEMVRGVQEIVEHLSNRDHMTMIVVTHQINFAENIADEVLFLEDGRILEDTPGKDFFKNPQTARVREFFDSMDFLWRTQMKDKNIFNWIISVLAIILVVVSAYFGFTQKGLNSGTSASRWSSQNGVSEIKRRGYIRVAV